MGQDDFQEPKLDRHEAEQLLDRCRRLTLETLASGLDQALNLVDDTLFAQAEKAQNNIEQTLFFDSMRDIRRQRSQITRAFHRQVSLNFRNFPFGNQSADTCEPEQEPDEDSMTLVHTEAYEDTVQITNLSNKARELCREQLFGLEQRLEQLNRGQPLSDKANPLSPRNIAESFASAIEPVGIHSRIKPDLYRLFEETTMAGLASIYDQANQWLIAANILPELSFSPRINPASATTAHNPHNPHNPQTPSGTDLQSAAPTPDSGSAPGTPSLAALHSQILHSLPPQPEPNRSRDQLLAALTRLQKRALEKDYRPFTSSAGADEFRTQLYSELDRDELDRDELGRDNEDAPCLSQEDDSNLRLMEQVFQTISHDPQVPDDFREQLTEMSLPWARIALEDSQFLEDQSHPARQLLDTMASAAGRYHDTPMLARTLHQHYQAIINTLSQVTRQRRSQLEALMQQLQQHLAALEHRAGLTEQRQIDAARGQETLHHARQQALNTVHNSCPSKIGPFAERFLSTLWAELLTICRLRHDPKTCADAEALTHKLGTALSDDHSLKVLIPDITRMLCQLSGHPQGAIEKIIEQLRLEARGSQTISLELLSPFQPLAAAWDGSNLTQSNPTHSQSTEEILDSLQHGSWFQVYDHDQIRSWKLAWCSQNHQHFLFVDGSGQKTALPDRQTLGNWLECGKLTPRDNTTASLLTRTLRTLRQQLPGAATD